MVTTISNLPPELHTHILLLSYTEKLYGEYEVDGDGDGNETDISKTLLLVSRYWNSVAKPFRLRKLRLRKVQNLSNVIVQLAAIPEHSRRVRHLDLSDSSVSVGAKAGVEGSLSFERSVLALLKMLAPTLHTLTIQLSNPLYATCVFADLWSIQMPQLLSISVSGLYAYPSAPSAISNFPLLEHIKFDGLTNPTGLLALTNLSSSFPKLEILEVFGLRGSLAFAREVYAVVTEHRHREYEYEKTESERSGGARLPRSLRTIVLGIASQPDFSHRKPSVRMQMLHVEMQKVLIPLIEENGDASYGRVQVEFREEAGKVYATPVHLA